MKGLNVHKNIPISITKLTLGLRVGFISSHLIADKLFPINPRAITGPLKMSLLLEANSMPALIIKPRFILVMRTNDLGWYCIPIDLMFQENFPTFLDFSLAEHVFYKISIEMLIIILYIS